ELERVAREASKPFTNKVGDVEKAINEAEAHQMVAAGDVKNGLAKLREVGGIEAAYLNRLQFQVGEKEPAEKAARDQANNGVGQVLPLAALVDMLWQVG